jgi:hypothetical protein
VGRGFSPEIGDEGAVSGRITDGYLTASGNFDADMNGMSGGGPYYQQVGGTFYLDSVQTRFPCSLTVSFWRNTFTSSDPPASAALTDNRVRITCLAGQFAIQGGTILLNPGEYYEFVGEIPLSSTGDPRSATGTYGGFATCDNTQVSIQARIEWNVQPRVHILLGIVRDCYEEFDPCATECDNDGRPGVVYVTISNFSLDPAATFYSASIANVNGTYALDRVPNLCSLWAGPETGDGCAGFTNAGQFVETGPNRAYVADMRMYIRTGYSAGGLDLCMDPLVLNVPTGTMPPICGTGVIASGSSTGGAQIRRNDMTDADGALVELASCTFDWEISA